MHAIQANKHTYTHTKTQKSTLRIGCVHLTMPLKIRQRPDRRYHSQTHMRMYVCEYMFMHLLHVYVCQYMSCMHVQSCMCMYVSVYVYACMYTHKKTAIYVRVSVCVHACMYTHKKKAACVCTCVSICSCRAM
jgi:hypothetical protein